MYFNLLLSMHRMAKINFKNWVKKGLEISLIGTCLCVQEETRRVKLAKALALEVGKVARLIITLVDDIGNSFPTPAITH